MLYTTLFAQLAIGRCSTTITLSPFSTSDGRYKIF